jgi:hypothetical protein
VHRDVKPSNLFLTRTGTVKVLDLGLALLTFEGPSGEPTATGQMLGTIDYVAPEQTLDTRQVDIRADLYSLGCTLYKLLTGTPPFGDISNAMQKIRAHSEKPFPPLTALRDDVPEGVLSLLERLSAKDPNDRPESPLDLVEEIEPYCEGADLGRLALVALGEDPDSSPIEPRKTTGSSTRNPVPASGSTTRQAERKSEPAVTAPRQWPLLPGLLVASALVLGLGMYVGTFFSPQQAVPGKLRIDSGQHPVLVSILKGEFEHQVTLHDKVPNLEFDLEPGDDYVLWIIDPGSQLTLKKDPFRIKDGETQTVDLRTEINKLPVPVDLPPIELTVLVEQISQEIATYMAAHKLQTYLIDRVSLPSAHPQLIPKGQMERWLETGIERAGLTRVDETEGPQTTISGRISVQSEKMTVRILVADSAGNELQTIEKAVPFSILAPEPH